MKKIGCEVMEKYYGQFSRCSAAHKQKILGSSAKSKLFASEGHRPITDECALVILSVSPHRFDVNADSGEGFRRKSRTGKRKRASPDGRSASVESKPGKRQKPGPLSTPARIKAFSACACSQLLTIAGNHPEPESVACIEKSALKTH